MMFSLFLLLSYVLGSIPSGKIVGLLHGIDLQKKGSGNIGFTNSLRTLGLKPAVFVLVGDTLKGFVPTFFALQFLPLNQTQVIGLIAILAHVFPVWLKFRGGKGVATGLGVTLALNPTVAIFGIITFLIVFLSTKIVSISSLISAFIFLVVSYFIVPELTLFFMTLLVIAIWTHRENVKRIIRGEEKRIIN